MRPYLFGLTSLGFLVLSMSLLLDFDSVPTPKWFRSAGGGMKAKLPFLLMSLSIAWWTMNRAVQEFR